jgi:TRAP-type C4-dicarboxylate transport system substrate-binding protein
LDKASQEAVLKAAQEAENRGWAVSQEKNNWYLNALSEKGMKIMKPSAQLMTDLKQVGQTMLANWEKNAGADGSALIASFNKK